MTQNKTVKPNFVLRLAFALLFLTMLSIHFSSGLYARYLTRDSVGESARVAVWNVQATGNETDLLIDCGIDINEDRYEITVSNFSEVAVQYDIILTFTKKLPQGVSLKLDNTLIPVQSSDGKTYTFENVNTLNCGNDVKKHVLSMVADSDAIEEDYEGSFTATVLIDQID